MYSIYYVYIVREIFFTRMGSRLDMHENPLFSENTSKSIKIKNPTKNFFFHFESSVYCPKIEIATRVLAFF